MYSRLHHEWVQRSMMHHVSKGLSLMQMTSHLEQAILVPGLQFLNRCSVPDVHEQIQLAPIMFSAPNNFPRGGSTMEHWAKFKYDYNRIMTLRDYYTCIEIS